MRFYQTKKFKIGVVVALLLGAIAVLSNLAQITSTVMLFVHGKAQKWRPPELPKDCKMVTVVFGRNFFSNPPEWFDGTNSIGLAALTITNNCPFNVRVKDRRIFVEATTILDSNLREVHISDEGDGRLPPAWDRNFTTNAFEIVDENTNPVFQVVYNRPNEVTINGVFVVPDGSVMMVFNGYERISKRALDRGEMFIQPKPKPLFKYPSWQYPEKFKE